MTHSKGTTRPASRDDTEQQVIALSGHRTPEAARGYIKRTEAQRESALLKRRAWVAAVKEQGAGEEQVGDESRNRAPAAESE